MHMSEVRDYFGLVRPVHHDALYNRRPHDMQTHAWLSVLFCSETHRDYRALVAAGMSEATRKKRDVSLDSSRARARAEPGRVGGEATG